MRMPYGWTAAMVTLVMIAASCRRESPAPIPWQPSLPLALESARDQGRPLFLYVTAAWCNICRRVEQDTLGDRDTVAALDAFVPVMIDIDQYPWVGERYEVAAVPAFLVLDSRGRVLRRAIGFKSPHEIRGLLQVARGESGSLD